MTRICLFAAACCLLPALPVTAQDDRPSHVPVPRTTDADPTQLFRDRIQNSQSRSDLDALLRQFGGAGRSFGTPEQMRQLLQSNPQLREMAERLQKDLRSGDPDTRDRLRGLIDSVIQTNPNLAGRMSADDVERQLRTLSPSRPGTNGGPPDRNTGQPVERPPTRTDPPGERPRPDAAQEAARRQWTNRIAEWAEKFPRDRLAGPLRDSPAVRDLFRRLSESAADALRNSGGADGLDAQLARMEARWRAARDWLPEELPESMRGLKLPDLSGVPQPNWQVPQLDVSPPAFSAPRFSSPGLDPGALANVALVLVGVVVIAGIVWRLRGGALAAEAAGRRPLGPWPLDPARVASREELIRAFEYLSLLRCGEPARAWHHRAIAACLGGAGAERRDAAARLAALYERARYAPAAGGEPDWSAARGPLQTLAGAG
jgi:hypothetical protein